MAREAAIVRAARLVVAETGATFDDALALARTTARATAPVAVAVEAVGEQGSSSGFGIGAQSQLILFMFLTALTGAAPSSRPGCSASRGGVLDADECPDDHAGRDARPVRVRALPGRFIVLASALLFGVDWIDPLATGAIVVLSRCRLGRGDAPGDGRDERAPVERARAGLGMMLALFGGAMVPPRSSRDHADARPPHAPRLGDRRLPPAVARGRNGRHVLPELGALGLFTVGLLTRTFRFRRQVTGGAI